MRPIDAEALSSLLFKRMGEYEALANDLPKGSYQGCVYYGKTTALYEVQLAIEREMPTLGYAPVVRCKDCMLWKTGGCWFHQPGKCVEREPNDFCSDGQRRSENG